MDYPDPQARNLDVNGKFQDESFDLPGDMNAVYDELIALISVLGGTAARGNLAQISTLLDSALDSKSNTGHGHAQSSITGLVAALAGKSATGHGHAQSSITGLVAALEGKSATGHGHVQAEITDVNFAGMVVAFPLTSAPTGFLKCNGAAVSRTSYSALFSAIGTIFGTGNGSTTFNLPDLRGDVIRGWDDGRGVDSGRALGSLQLDALQNITGTLRSGSRGSFGSSNSGAFSAPYGSSLHGSGTNFSSSSSVDFDASLVVRTSDETRARNSALTLCIKY